MSRDRGVHRRVGDDEPLIRFVASRSVILLGLTGLAIAQPLLDLFGNNAEFFVAGGYSTSQVVAFALFVTLVPPAVAIGLITVGAAVDRRLGSAVFIGVAGILAATFGLALLRTVGIDVLWGVAMLAAVIGAGIATLLVRYRAVRLFVGYLGAANVLFLGSFMFVSPASAFVTGGGVNSDVGDVRVPLVNGPVVVVVLDEFPASTILRADGTINDARYPGFARLADVSTWFRNAASTEISTAPGVPAIMTGRDVDDDESPTAASHPRNLFTLLGNDLPVHRYERVTDLCPRSICVGRQSASFRQALKDASIVYGHRLLPSAFRNDLPAIDNSWGEYGAEDGGDVVAARSGDGMPSQRFERWDVSTPYENSPLGQAVILSQQLESVDADPVLHMVHVGVPHFPWTLSRTGISATNTGTGRPSDLDPESEGFEFRARVEYQKHSMQVGAIDAVIDDAIDSLMALPNWDDLTLVVTSDHGISLTPPDLDRETVTDRNREEVYRVPLFVKAPRQTTGEVRDDPAETIDIVPSLIDLLNIEVDDDIWAFDGHSLFDGSERTHERLVSNDVQALVDIAARHAAEFSFGDDWLGLAAVGEHGDLVGRTVSDLRVGEPSDYDVSLDADDVLDDLPTDDNRVPFVLTGTVSSQTYDDPPTDLLAVVNGRVAGVVGGFRSSDGGWSVTGYVADFYRDGENTVEVYEVDGAKGDVVLHPLP